MLSGKDIYRIVDTITPLYVAMILAYASVRFWKIFTPQQCAGVNKYVATFTVPILSFQVIASCNFYDMNYRFLRADTLQKVVILALLVLWLISSQNASLEWVISFFSLATLPNTLVIGIPLLQAIGAMILINEHFPDCSRGITSIRVDPDVSLKDNELLEADAEIDDDGKVHVVVRRSSASSMGSTLRKSLQELNSVTTIPRASNLSGVEIYSLQSWSRTSSLNTLDGHYGSQKHRISGSSTESDWIIDAETNRIGKRSYRGRNLNSKLINGFLFPSHRPSHPSFMTSPSEMPMMSRDSNSSEVPAKGLHMEAWGSIKDKSRHASSRITNCSDLGAQEETATFTGTQNFQETKNKHAENAPELSNKEGNVVNTELGMPPWTVMTRLIVSMAGRKLIRNLNLYASILGLAWSLLSFKLHLHMPLIVSGSIQILSDTCLGMAMFSLGLFMGSQPTLVPCGYPLATLAMALRFIVGPLVAAGTSAVLGLRGHLLRISIVQAALPEAIVPFVFAREYKVHADIMSVGWLRNTVDAAGGIALLCRSCIDLV